VQAPLAAAQSLLVVETLDADSRDYLSWMECEITVSRKSLITCPQCGFQQEEDMPSDSCLFFYECVACRSRLRPFPEIVVSSVRMARQVSVPTTTTIFELTVIGQSTVILACERKQS